LFTDAMGYAGPDDAVSLSGREFCIEEGYPAIAPQEAARSVTTPAPGAEK
jgi:hypothetical protein